MTFKLIEIMKGKLPKKKLESKLELEEDPLSREELLEEHEDEEVPFVPRMIRQDTLFITFTGILRSGFLPEDDSLTAFCTIMHGADWARLSG